MSAWRELDERALRDWPLPAIPADADKETRGRVLVIAGSREVPGAAQLAAVAALRAGAGKLVIATAASSAQNLAQSVPEARVIALPENETGSFDACGIALLEPTLGNVSAVLVGPGMVDERGNAGLIQSIIDTYQDGPLVLDALAMDVVAQLRRFSRPVLMTPHAGEMAHLLGIEKDEVTREPQRIALSAASRWNAVVALKGAVTWIATPGGQCWRHAADEPGLATSGSGDVLAGLIAGFAARDASLEQACAWGVVMHALAGRALSRQIGPIGYLARELPGAVPGLMKGIRAKEA
jgi:ADP-dependent NAD(P)H-hydrate dehydratase